MADTVMSRRSMVESSLRAAGLYTEVLEKERRDTSLCFNTYNGFMADETVSRAYELMMKAQRASDQQGEGIRFNHLVTKVLEEGAFDDLTLICISSSLSVYIQKVKALINESIGFFTAHLFKRLKSAAFKELHPDGYLKLDEVMMGPIDNKLNFDFDLRRYDPPLKDLVELMESEYGGISGACSPAG